MATFRISELEIRTDRNKANPVIEHDYRPLKDYDDVVVRCSYFTAGERMGYMQFGQDGRVNMDMVGIFRDKVHSISGLIVEGKDGREHPITTAKELLSYPDVSVLSAIVMGTATHIVESDGLSEAEEKN